MKFTAGLLAGAFLSWLITADHYGRIMTNTTRFGLMCRMYGLDTVTSYHSVFDQTSLCVDLTYATPEDDLKQDFWDRFNRNWSQPH